MVRMDWSRPIGVLLVTAFAAALMAACSAEAGPETAPSSSVTTSATTSVPSPTRTSGPTADPKEPVEPSLPAAARAASRAGAEAFVRYYVNLVNYAGRTGEVKALERAALGCGSCESLATAFRKTYAAGGHYETAGWRVTSQFTTPSTTEGWVSLLKIRQSAMVWFETDNADPQRTPAKNLSLRFQVRRVGGIWRITEFTQS